eukprot:3667939-Rhodomonas_salina.2
MSGTDIVCAATRWEKPRRELGSVSLWSYALAMRSRRARYALVAVVVQIAPMSYAYVLRLCPTRP